MALAQKKAKCSDHCCSASITLITDSIVKQDNVSSGYGAFEPIQYEFSVSVFPVVGNAVSNDD